MSRTKLIREYERLCRRYDEVDAWESDIEPKLDSMSAADIKEWYEADKAWYEYRERYLISA